MACDDFAALMKDRLYQECVLGGFNGSYMMGVVSDPKCEGRAALRLMVEGSDISRFPSSLTVLHENVLIQVASGFTFPTTWYSA